jgi:hypothetical protein
MLRVSPPYKGGSTRYICKAYFLLHIPYGMVHNGTSQIGEQKDEAINKTLRMRLVPPDILFGSILQIWDLFGLFDFKSLDSSHKTG